MDCGIIMFLFILDLSYNVSNCFQTNKLNYFNLKKITLKLHCTIIINFDQPIITPTLLVTLGRAPEFTSIRIPPICPNQADQRRGHIPYCTRGRTRYTLDHRVARFTDQTKQKSPFRTENHRLIQTLTFWFLIRLI